MYIQAPYEQQPITILKGKPFKIKPAKREDVPEFYRKKTLKHHLYEILLYVVGFEEFIRKEVSEWALPQKTKQLFKSILATEKRGEKMP